MKKLIKTAYTLIATTLLLCGCSEDTFLGNNTEEGKDVTISLTYSDVSPRDIVVNTRATEAEERHLDNLYIYVFDGNGNLKGYKDIESGLDQETNENHKAAINGIKTRAGEAYIYAVANIQTGLYPVSTSSGSIENGKLPIHLDESKAQAGDYDFTLEDLKALSFLRNNPNTIQISSAFLMSGAVKQGNAVNISTAGQIANGDNSIRLSRIVSKVKFTIKALKESGVQRSFKLSTYDIMNIAIDGSLIGKTDGNTRKMIDSENSVSHITGLTRGVNDVESDGSEMFEVYLPENLQDAIHIVSSQPEREDDSESSPKVFTNAPLYGTYVVLKGKYEETKNGVSRSADVKYFVHLGDCSLNPNNYDVERNCKYTFNITVAGVDKIIVEAQKQGNEQPGAEGVVLEYGNMGKNLMLDSHYEYMVMRFYQQDILNLKKAGLGYYYQVYALGNHTDAMNVGVQTTGSLNGVDTSWIQFAIKCDRDKSTSSYSSENDNRGEACSYPGTKHQTNLYSIEEFLKYLYNNADINSFWTGSDSQKGKYIDATCFVSENYYSNLAWNKYVNNVDKRAFYVANAVETSTDGRSVYAKAQYGLTQHNIQTFYDRSQANKIVAYGCETINDEKGKNFTANGGGSKYGTSGTDKWNGRNNMMKDITSSDSWATIQKNKSLIKACMSRNRDLNGDGKISNDEIRWYAPTIDQYVGIWIGEEIMSTEAKLFNKLTSTLKGESDRMLYYSSTNGQNTYFSEEGMATNHYHSGNTTYPPTLVRCLRNLKSNDEGYDQTPDKYYTWSLTTRQVSLDKVDENALNVTGEQGELNSHTERSAGNKPAKTFTIANNTYVDKSQTYKVWVSQNNRWYEETVWNTQKQVVEGTVKCYGNYSESGDKKWRVPNQRELSVMYLINPELIKDTYCKTLFSNTSFRKSWTYNGVFTMNVGAWDATGAIRCIKVKK